MNAIVNVKQQFQKRTFVSRLLLLEAVLILFVSAGYCQQTNYSGDCALNLNKSKLEAYWTSGITKGIVKIVHNEPNFSFWRSFTIKGKEQVTEYAIQTNGQEQKGKHRTTWTLSWKQDTLILAVKRKNMLNTVKYYFSADRDLVADEYFDSPSMKYHNHWVFEKEIPKADSI